MKNPLEIWRAYKLYSIIKDGIDKPKKLREAKFWVDLIKTAKGIREIRDMFTALQGYKSYIVAILTGVLTVAHSLGYIDDATFQTLLALLGSGAIATVAAKINRLKY